jgi:hypothetical protein
MVKLEILAFDLKLINELASMLEAEISQLIIVESLSEPIISTYERVINVCFSVYIPGVTKITYGLYS